MPLFDQVDDQWYNTRKNYKYWHRNDFITQLQREASGVPGIGASGDFLFTQTSSQKSSTNIQAQKAQDNSRVATPPVSPPSPINVKATNSANQSIPTGVVTVLNFDTTTFDTGTQHNNVVNNSRLTCQEPGLYLAGANVIWQSNAVGTRGISIRFNGTAQFAQQQAATSPTTQTEQQISGLQHLSAGDYIESTVFQDSGGALNSLALVGFLPTIWMVKVG